MLLRSASQLSVWTLLLQTATHTVCYSMTIVHSGVTVSCPHVAAGAVSRSANCSTEAHVTAAMQGSASIALL